MASAASIGDTIVSSIGSSTGISTGASAGTSAVSSGMSMIIGASTSSAEASWIVTSSYFGSSKSGSFCIAGLVILFRKSLSRDTTLTSPFSTVP